MGRGLFLNTSAYGHVNPTIPVVSELVRRGEGILYFTAAIHQPALEEAGASYQPYPHAAPQIAVAGDTLADLAEKLLTTAERITPTLDAIVEDFKPDYIIHDSLAPWGKYLAARHKLPAISSITTFAFAQPRQLAHLGQMLRFVRAQPIHPHRFVQIAQTYDQLLRQYGLPNEGVVDLFQNSEALNIIYTVREFQPQAARFDNTYHFVGTSIPEQDGHATWLVGRLGTDRLIYVSLGTIMNNAPHFYQLAYDAFEGTEYQIVMSVGQVVSEDTIAAAPDNFIVCRYVPQLSVLQHASAFITHGGMNSVHEALHFGVPMVVVPRSPEQVFVGRQVIERGAGQMLSWEQLSVEGLRHAVDQVIADPVYAANSRFIGHLLRQAGGYHRAAEEILTYVEQHRR
ncbi:MAG: hypothetical protein GYB68_09445 [Chloroflexi bacterium]|nr:hypothetical protein [Chloroflexota bacterium]